MTKFRNLYKEQRYELTYFYITEVQHNDFIFSLDSRVDKQRNEPGRWKSRIVAIFLLFLTLLHVLT